jgi:hypothetical protein
MEPTDSNRQLIPFLRNLADSVERGNIPDDKLRMIGEFFMSYVSIEHMENTNRDEDMRDFLKFLFLGYYIHRILLPNVGNDENAQAWEQAWEQSIDQEEVD